jgi:hypothetical protein
VFEEVGVVDEHGDDRAIRGGGRQPAVVAETEVPLVPEQSHGIARDDGGLVASTDRVGSVTFDTGTVFVGSAERSGVSRALAKRGAVAVALVVVTFVLLGFWPTAVQPVEDTLEIDHEPDDFGPAHYYPENGSVRFWVTARGTERAFEPFGEYACWYGEDTALDRLQSLLDDRFRTGDSGVRWDTWSDRIVVRDAPLQGPTRRALRHSLPGRVNVSVELFDRSAECSFPVDITRPTGERGGF